MHALYLRHIQFVFKGTNVIINYVLVVVLYTCICVYVWFLLRNTDKVMLFLLYL